MQSHFLFSLPSDEARSGWGGKGMVEGAFLQGLLYLCRLIIITCVNNHDACMHDSNHRQYALSMI